MERTEKLMMTAIVRYREDRDLENAIDFVQKKVTTDVFMTLRESVRVRPFIIQRVVFAVSVLWSSELQGLVPQHLL